MLSTAKAPENRGFCSLGRINLAISASGDCACHDPLGTRSDKIASSECGKESKEREVEIHLLFAYARLEPEANTQFR